MKHETITKELEVKAKHLLNSSKYKLKSTKGLEFFEEYGKHIKKADRLTDELNEAMNDLLKKYNVEFENDTEKESFLVKIRPVFLETLQNFLKP